MKFIIGIILLIPFSMNAAVIHYSVGTGSCEFSTPQEAIDSIQMNNSDGSGVDDHHLHLTDETFTGTVYVQDIPSLLVTGGYSDCHAASNMTRKEGSFSVIDGDSNVAMILANNEEIERQVKITGIHVTNGQNAGFIPSGGINVIGKIELQMYESRLFENEGIFGGGIYAGVGSEVSISTSLIDNNDAELGGGVYCTDCLLILNVGSGISDNDASVNGGGVFINEQANFFNYAGSTTPQLDKLGIHSNQALQHGGGIYVDQSYVQLIGYEFNGSGDDVNPVSITKNTASIGGGIYSNLGVIVSKSIDISNNMVSESGAGVSLNFNSYLTMDLDGPVGILENCWNNNVSQCNLMRENIVQNGSATGARGGAIDVNDSIVEIEHTWFESNDAGGQGDGAVLAFNSSGTTSTIDHAVFHNNGALTGDDNSIINIQTSSVHIRQSTLADNNIQHALLHIEDGSSEFQLLNSIVNNLNFDPVFDFIGAAFVHTECVLTHDASTFPLAPHAENVFTGDPMFYDRSNNDFRLRGESVLTIDRCEPIVNLDEFDLALQNRQFDVESLNNNGSNYVDMGAFEYQGIDPDIIFQEGFDNN